MSAITVPRAVLEQALEALGFSCPAPDLMDKHKAAEDSLRTALEQALEALENCTSEHGHRCSRCDSEVDEGGRVITALRAALAQQEQEPVAWTDRELQLIDGMIEVQLHHAAQCDGIANRTMAEKQKGWDMERVALLQKIKSNPPRREWQGLKEWEINDGRDQLPTEDLCNWSFRQGVYFAEDKLKEKNNG